MIFTMLKRVFDIREGEFKRTAWMFLYLLLLITALMIVKPVSTALFLDQFGARHLPLAYMLTAVLAATISFYYSSLLKTKALAPLMRSTLIITSALLGLFWVFIYFQLIKGTVLYLFFVWCSLATLICASQFWLAAGFFFNVREAKRLFGPVGSGAIIGGIAGGYMTRILVPVVGSIHMILLAVICLFFCIAIMGKLWHNYGRNILPEAAGKASLEAPGTRLTILQVMRSRHLRYTALILAISVITARLVDYQFNVIVSGIISDKDQLAAFLGLWMSNLNLVSLLIQLLITRKILEIYGVSRSLLFMPAAVQTVGPACIRFSPCFRRSGNGTAVSKRMVPVPSCSILPTEEGKSARRGMSLSITPVHAARPR